MFISSIRKVEVGCSASALGLDKDQVVSPSSAMGLEIDLIDLTLMESSSFPGFHRLRHVGRIFMSTIPSNIIMTLRR